MKLAAKANTLSWFWAFPQHGTQCKMTDMFPPVLFLMTIQPLKGKTVSVHSCTSTSGSQLSWDINILGHWVWVIWCSSSRVPGLPRDQGATGVVCFFTLSSPSDAWLASSFTVSSATGSWLGTDYGSHPKSHEGLPINFLGCIDVYISWDQTGQQWGGGEVEPNGGILSTSGSSEDPH